MIPVLLGVTVVTFLIFYVVGGDPSFQLAGKSATLEQIQSIRIELGLNKPLLSQYFDFLRQTLTFQWGQSWHTHENINQMIINGIGPSLSLTLPAFLISFIFSLIIALFSAWSEQGPTKRVDKWITSICLSLMSISFLVYIISFQYFLAFDLGLFPINGWDSSWSGRWTYLVLPWIISIFVSLGPNILIFRTAILDQASQDYVRTAQAKGLSALSTYFVHVLKNAMIPIITVVVLQIPFLMTGSLLLESFFGIPGLGGLLIQSIQNADFPVIKAFTIIGSILYLFFNLMADILYAWIDPRVKLT